MFTVSNDKDADPFFEVLLVVQGDMRIKMPQILGRKVKGRGGGTVGWLVLGLGFKGVKVIGFLDT